MESVNKVSEAKGLHLIPNCSRGSRRIHELIYGRAEMSATNRAMVKQLDISLAWWRVKELHTNSFVEDVEY